MSIFDTYRDTRGVTIIQDLVVLVSLKVTLKKGLRDDHEIYLINF